MLGYKDSQVTFPVKKKSIYLLVFLQMNWLSSVVCCSFALLHQLATSKYHLRFSVLRVRCNFFTVVYPIKCFTEQLH